MRVRMLVDQPYEPQPGDSQRCLGQLRKRVTRREITFSPDHGVKDECGPMRHFFPKGSTPDLREDVAREWLTSGVSVLFDGAEVIMKTAAEMLQDVARPE